MKTAGLLLAALLLTASPALSAPAKPEIVTRAQWGSKAEPIPDSRRQVPVWITIHHAGEAWSAGQDPADFIRRMQRYGQNRPRIEPPPRNTYWPDLPYHYLIAPDGRIFEGRPVEYEPESNTRYPLNGNIGVEMMGDFNKQRPSLAQLRSVVSLTAWLAHEHGIGLEHVRAHRDAAPTQTDCPGKDFYRYFADGAFKNWVRQALANAEPAIDPGPPLPDGPTAPIP
ncbi:MAG: peptidoglycan recognition family protein [Elusimicrobia bacterium]|nr:peptidoglycan recognition family protein [Elusimicrobiota bacterium]